MSRWQPDPSTSTQGLVISEPTFQAGVSWQPVFKFLFSTTKFIWKKKKKQYLIPPKHPILQILDRKKKLLQPTSLQLKAKS